MSTAYLAVPNNVSPYLTLYKRTTDALVKLTDPTSLPVSDTHTAGWSPDGGYLTVGQTLSPFIVTYKRTADTFVKLADPAILPTGDIRGASWSLGAAYVSVVHITSPYVTTYKRAGDVLTRLADPATLPAGSGYSAEWSPDGTYLTVGHQTAPYITIYKRSGDVLTKLSDPAVLPAGPISLAVAWSSDGVYLSVGHAVTPFVTTYKRSGDVFTKIADPTTLPASQVQDVRWSPGGAYMTVGMTTTPFVTTYKRSGDVLTKLADPATLPAGASQGVSWSRDSAYLTVGHQVSPFITNYKRSADTFVKLTDPTTLPTSASQGLAWSTSDTPPDAPAIVSPTGAAVVDQTIIQRLSWTFIDQDTGDTQTAADVRYRVVGAAAWTAVSNATSSAFVDLAANTLTSADYEWQVRTYDVRLNVGSYCGSSFFTAALPPSAPTITAPADASTVGTRVASVTWTATTQTAYQVRTVADAAGVADPSVIYTDTGKLTSSSVRTASVNFATAGIYLHVQVRVLARGLWGPWADSRVQVAYTLPAVALLALATYVTGGVIVASWTDPTPSGSQPVVASHNVYRRETLAPTTTAMRVATGRLTSWPDFTTDSGRDYAYQVESIGTTGEASFTAWVTAATATSGTYPGGGS